MNRGTRVLVASIAASLVAAAALAGPASSVAPVAPIATAAMGQAGGSAPIVEITKKCPDLRYLGRDATFEITVTNRGGGAAQNVVVTDVITGSVSFASADNGGSQQGNKVVWNLGNLPAGESRNLKVNLHCTTMGTVKNTASVTYCAAAEASCEMQVRGIPGVLLEVVDEADPIEVGQNETYTIIVTNQGTAEDTNIIIQCEIPPQMTFVSAAGATVGTNSGQNVTFAPLPRLGTKERATFKVVCKGINTAGNDTADVRFKTNMLTDQTKAVGAVMETESTHIYE